MNRTAIIVLLSTALTAGSAFAQQNQKLSFNDNNGVPNSGTYSPDAVFSISVSLKYRGYNSLGLSYWLEVQNGLAPNISITNVTYFTFLDPNQTGPNPAFFNSSVGAHAGYQTETRDLGGTAADISMSVPPGTYLIASIQFTLSGAAPGTYLLKSTTVSPHASEVSDDNFVAHNLPASAYRLTITSADGLMSVPEPTTFSLLCLAAMGFGMAAYRRRRAAS